MAGGRRHDSRRRRSLSLGWVWRRGALVAVRAGVLEEGAATPDVSLRPNPLERGVVCYGGVSGGHGPAAKQLLARCFTIESLVG